ncbi:polysaccharide deacetylase [Rhizobium sp. SSA_523]|uniref:polysaccharide deacetylase n=1 Tax=Rhizobium sp. SSA_523 TaxID=2952477 RepID=UPI002091BE68|nr:polysaccharide deacetylase [Rhizobium sp. SSA_523]MCO5730501.1 polysaccharide deacetylase [Rhizobium sp. SSA_523]WKC25684.1 polysaccharide deacetylase [Rhizobium sp. SSA_523]
MAAGGLTAFPALAETAAKPKQLLLMSFDGAGSNPLWERSRRMAERVNARFTYFLSCTLVIDWERARSYKGPHHAAGRSNIGFAQTKDEALARLDHVWQAHREGHEIASHTCGHFDGRAWSVEDWRAEMQSFRTVLSNGFADLGAAKDEPEGWRAFVAAIEGFRAPYLSTSKALAEAERLEGFTYDASGVTKGPQLPQQTDGVLSFGLPLIPEGPQARKIIAMDYNLYMRHSSGTEKPDQSAQFEERAYQAFRSAFDAQYEGDRIPLQIGLHFVEMNAGAYWRAMERLASDVCARPDVGCITYREAAELLRASEKPPAGSGL